MRKNLMQQTFNVLVCSPKPASRAGSGWQFNGNKPCADDSHGSRARQKQTHARSQSRGHYRKARQGSTAGHRVDSAQRRDLFILIDDAARTSVSSQFGDLREFIYSLPKTTSVGVGYMRNGNVQVAQDLTTDRRRAANALRIPIGSPGAYGSPYLSVIDLMKRWPESSNRREIMMITDGIERRHGWPHRRGLGPISPDVSAASAVAQRTGTIIHSIYTRGVGWRGSDFWQVTNGQNAMAKLADETGGESFFLGIGEPVSFRPHLDRLQSSLDNRYRLEFNAMPGKKPGLQYVKLTTEVAGIELDSADSVWVAAR
jgi:hypothetical protein